MTSLVLNNWAQNVPFEISVVWDKRRWNVQLALPQVEALDTIIISGKIDTLLIGATQSKLVGLPSEKELI